MVFLAEKAKRRYIERQNGFNYNEKVKKWHELQLKTALIKFQTVMTW